MANLFLVDIRLLKRRPSLLELLDQQRLACVKKLRNNRDKLHCLAAGLILRHLFGQDAEIKENPWHKPYIEGKPRFNLSHSGDYVICAVGESEIGCDIQNHSDVAFKPDIGEIAKRVFHPAELKRFLAASAREETFYDFWTLKESYMKALGKGFHLEPNTFHLDVRYPEASLVETPEPAFRECRFSLFRGIPGYTMAICAADGEVLPEHWQDITHILLDQG